MNFAQNLARIMKKKEITMYRLSKLLGVHPTTIKNWLDGNTEPKTEMLIKIADVLKVSPSELLMDVIKDSVEILDNFNPNDHKTFKEVTFNDLVNDQSEYLKGLRADTIVKYDSLDPFEQKEANRYINYLVDNSDKKSK